MNCNDYTNNHVRTGIPPQQYVRNRNNIFDGYPKLQKLQILKHQQIEKHLIKPFGCRVSTEKILPTLKTWCDEYHLQFDIIMIGALVENQFLFPLLTQLPLLKLCSKPGFLYIWATKEKIDDLGKLLNNFNKKFRRSEELIFLPVKDSSIYDPYHDPNAAFLNQQWHCWMCITGTVRRSTDLHLIHCNVDTDLQFEADAKSDSNAVPDSMYRVAENFSNMTRRLHIVPAKVGYNKPLRLRPGWVIMGPDVFINNFNPVIYETELCRNSLINYKNDRKQYLISQTNEVEEIRPKSPRRN